MRNRVSTSACYNLVTIRAKASTLPAWKGWRTAFARIPGMAIVLFACLAVLARPAAAQVFDDFESYAVGSNLHGQGGWAGWMGNASAGALVSTNFSFSPIRSVNITGASDLVHTFSGATNGQWVFSVMQYIPSSSTGDSYVILMNTYQAPYVNGLLCLSWVCAGVLQYTTSLNAPINWVTAPDQSNPQCFVPGPAPKYFRLR